MKKKEICKVISQEMIDEGIYSMWLSAPAIAADAVPGQFVSVYCKDGSRLLPRPISLCEIEKEEGKLRLVYRVAGKGTEEFSGWQAGQEAEVLGPLGNGFPLELCQGKRVCLMGGGIGVPPMLETAKALKNMGITDVTAVMGYRSTQFLAGEFAETARLVVATEDGSAGARGNVLDAMREQKIACDVIFACGPAPMLRAIKAYAAKNHILCYISMEEKMACGVGACLACVCKSTEVDHHSYVHNKRICKDGPVFEASEVEL